MGALDAYLQTLPNGLESFGGCTSKASIVRPLLGRFPLDGRADDFPTAIQAFVDDPPPPSRWLPTVLVNAIELAVIDAHALSERSFQQAALEMNTALLSSRLYAPLVFVSSPAFLLRMSAAVWGRFHRGSTLSATFQRQRAQVALKGPVGLFPDLVALEKGTAFTAALEAAGAKEVVLTHTPERDGETLFDATWRED